MPPFTMRPQRKHVLLIVTAQQQEAANKAVVELAGPQAANTFRVPCYMGDGQPKTPTHYVACWSMDDELLAKVEAALKKLKGTKPTIAKRTTAATAKAGEFKGRPVDELKRRGAKHVKQITVNRDGARSR